MTYSQSLTYYAPGTFGGVHGRQLLEPIFGIARMSPTNPHTRFSCTRGGVLVELAIPHPGLTNLEVWSKLGKGTWNDYEWSALGPRGSRNRRVLETAADLLFENVGDTVTIYADDYSTYAHLSYFIERQKIRVGARGLFESGNDDYLTPP
jgi:hypothetical protein